MRRTKLICTIGPRTESTETLEQMVAAGMDIARLNMSHATHSWTRQVVSRVRAASRRLAKPCAVLLDTQGPGIRTGDLREPMQLNVGDLLELTVKGVPGEGEKSVEVNYPNLVNDVHDLKTGH